MSFSDLTPEDINVLRWIADGGRYGRPRTDLCPATGNHAVEQRRRLERAGCVWADGTTPEDGRHVVAGLGLIALAQAEGKA